MLRADSLHLSARCVMMIMKFKDGIPTQHEHDSSRLKPVLSSPTHFHHVSPEVSASFVLLRFSVRLLLHAAIHPLPVYNCQFEAQKVRIISHNFALVLMFSLVTADVIQPLKCQKSDLIIISIQVSGESTLMSNKCPY